MVSIVTATPPATPLIIINRNRTVLIDAKKSSRIHVSIGIASASPSLQLCAMPVVATLSGSHAAWGVSSELYDR